MDATFTTTVMAGTAGEAAAKLAQHLGKVAGFAPTGRVQVRSAKHLLWDVEVVDQGGDKNDCWVVLTSFGMNPGKALGAGWQTVNGVGA